MTATYRLQLHAGFTFADARAIVPYLAELGITHLYLSPIMQAAPGSTHGYDVVDSDRVSAELGGEAGFAALAAEARALGLAILLDIVPNHMSIAGTGNAWWMDVLENGSASYFAHFFDVDWSGDDRVTLPVLGERYGRALANGALGVIYDASGFAIRAAEARYPIAPESLGRIVVRAGERARVPELAFIGDALAGLPRATSTEARVRRHRDKAVLARRLGELAATSAAALQAEIAAVNADKVELDAVLEAQAYRLVHWSVSASALSYRRFFDVNNLVGLRIEDLDVFEARHTRVLAWLADGTIAGVRIDHVDGLRDPAAYLARLRERAPDAWIVVEKILAPGEALPPWPVDGTTGYDFAERVGALLVDPAGEAPLTRLFEELTGEPFDVAAGRRAARRDVMSDALHSEIVRLVELAARACAHSVATRDYTRTEIEQALVEIFAGYPVYRTYDGGDRASIATAARAAAGDADLVAFLELALAGEIAQPDARALAIAARQVTGAVVAKGDEDTAGYRLVRLAARCEVGADLATFALPPDAIHRALAAAPPRSLLATATHDTKRGEDTRARLAVLSEVPAAWRAFVLAARDRANRYWSGASPDRTLEYLAWQSLVGAWPIAADRALAFAEKAAREARRRTSWRAPDAAFEAAVRGWITGVLGDAELCAHVAAFVATLAPRARANSLAQLLIKLTAPGVPDIYQGCELADLSLVDPDNRRPVDYAARRDGAIDDDPGLPAVGSIAEGRCDAIDDLGTAKLWTIRRVLALRRARPALFAAPYAALAASGPRADRVFAFARGDELVVAVPRIGAIDPETRLELAPGTWHDALTDRDHTGAVALATLWSALPVALLVRHS